MGPRKAEKKLAKYACFFIANVVYFVPEVIPNKPKRQNYANAGHENESWFTLGTKGEAGLQLGRALGRDGCDCHHVRFVACGVERCQGKESSDDVPQQYEAARLRV